jgi:hypothetical protein
VASDKWDNYYLTNNDTIENIAYSQQDKNDLSGDLVCLDLLNAANACWDDWNPVRATACYSVAWALYLACVAGTTGF